MGTAFIVNPVNCPARVKAYEGGMFSSAAVSEGFEGTLAKV
jgi:hypothetical protein